MFEQIILIEERRHNISLTMFDKLTNNDNI